MASLNAGIRPSFSAAVAHRGGACDGRTWDRGLADPLMI
jgi:hypothetical protein